MRTTIMEVDIEKFRRNIFKIKKYVNKNIMPIVKANAYGTYLNKDIDLMNEFDIVGVALVDEAINLRKDGYKNEILVINQPYQDELKDIAKYNITIGLSSFEFLDKINDNIKVHLEIETRMNRTGIKLDELDEFIKKVKANKKIKVEGIYTHLSSADFDEEYTLRQYCLFEKALKKVQKEFETIKHIHTDASNGLLKYNNHFTNLARIGIIEYGYYSFPEAKELIGLEPIAILKSKITFLKTVEKGEAISYSQTFKTKKKSVIATVPIGYADGFRRSFRNGKVIINNKRAKIVGTICMDSMMVDVTNIKDVKVGTDVYLWDNENITLEDLAKKAKTINYEIMSTISDRVPRIFKGR